MRPSYPVVELLGDGIGAELSRSIHTLADALPVKLDFQPVDLTLANRRARGRAVYDEAVEAVQESKFALKYPTVTAEESPNAVLRRRLDLSVIHRPVYDDPRRAEQLPPRTLDLDIVRIATGGTYDDPGRAIGDDGAVSPPDRRAPPGARGRAVCLRPGERKYGSEAGHSAPRNTRFKKPPTACSRPSPVEVAQQFPDIPHGVRAVRRPARPRSSCSRTATRSSWCLNEYGDFLSDMACGLIGSLGHRRQRQPRLRRLGRSSA